MSAPLQDSLKPLLGTRRVCQIAVVVRDIEKSARAYAEFFGLPVGLSFVGRAWSDAKLLALAADFEAATTARREPTFLTTVNEISTSTR